MISSAPGNADKRPLAAQFVDGPHVSAPGKAEQRLNDWLAELEPAQSAAIDQLTDHPHAKDILLGIAEFSPYLFDLMRADAARLKRLLACDPESHLAKLIEKTSREMLVASGETDVMHLLRRMKAEAALLIALCDIGGGWPALQGTGGVTGLPVGSVQMALGLLLWQRGPPRPRQHPHLRPPRAGRRATAHP